MKIIYKYKIAQEIDLPRNAKVLTVQTQKNIPYIWVIFDSDYKLDLEKRKFFVMKTGLQAFLPEDDFRYIGTFQLDGGDFVGHLFEEVEY